MTWDTLKDYMNAFIAILIILVPLIKEARKDGKKSIGYIVFLFISCVVLFFLGKDKIDRDSVNEIKFEKKRISDSVQTAKLTNDMSNIKRSDSAMLSQINASLIPYKLQLKDNRIVPLNITFGDNKSTNVSSNNQKGGQTAAKIVNH